MHDIDGPEIDYSCEHLTRHSLFAVEKKVFTLWVPVLYTAKLRAVDREGFSVTMYESTIFLRN